MTVSRVYNEHPEDVIAVHFPASRAAAQVVLRQSVGEDTRSDFTWIRLVNGDLILGVFPQGEGYFGCERDVEADYQAAGGDGSPSDPYEDGLCDDKNPHADHWWTHTVSGRQTYCEGR